MEPVSGERERCQITQCKLVLDRKKDNLSAHRRKEGKEWMPKPRWLEMRGVLKRIFR